MALGIEHTMQHTDDVLWSGTFETYIIFKINVTNKFSKI